MLTSHRGKQYARETAQRRLEQGSKRVFSKASDRVLPYCYQWFQNTNSTNRSHRLPQNRVQDGGQRERNRSSYPSCDKIVSGLEHVIFLANRTTLCSREFYWALNRVNHNCESSVSLGIRASGNIPRTEWWRPRQDSFGSIILSWKQNNLLEAARSNNVEGKSHWEIWLLRKKNSANNW